MTKRLSRSSNAAPICCAVVLSVFLAGCASTPLKGQPDLLNFVADGKTSKEEALLKLGAPSAKFSGERILTYRLGLEPKNHGYYVVGRMSADSGWTSWAGVKYSLVLVFDDAGVLQKHSLVEVR